jgi:hypothetical protein
MTLAAVLFGVILSTAYGAAYHFFQGGDMKRLALFVVLSGIGFWAGQYAAWSFDLGFFEVGALSVGTATLGSLIFLVGGHYLSRIEISKE